MVSCTSIHASAGAANVTYQALLAADSRGKITTADSHHFEPCRRAHRALSQQYSEK